jgi:gamma-glutamyl hercynylcysteine S-oxide synthase
MTTLAAPPTEPLSPAARHGRAAEIRHRFERIRERTLSLVAPLEWATLRKQHTPILSPMVWDLGHIANFEELWLVQRAAGKTPLVDDYGPMFDAMLNPRKDRERLPLPDQRTLFHYMGRVREAALETLDRWAEEGSADDRLLRDGFAFELIAEHEEQHQETILQALQLLDDPPYVPALSRPTPAGSGESLPEMVKVDAGPFVMGTDDHGFAYDNERRAHRVDLPTFCIDTTPVSVGRYLGFVEDGGYRHLEIWSDGGRAWLDDAKAEAPGNWRRDGRDGWRVRDMARERAIDRVADRPVMHVTYWEAEAYARWAGKRLPTEAEWEKAASWDPGRGVKRRYPWGDAPWTPERANLDQLAFGPAPVGAYPAGASAYGVHQVVGDCWEWTSSDFAPYPGFEAFPYAEYSEVFFGPDHKVLRGGSWATRPGVARATFRNWDYPIRRQIFTGIRCARDE